jgi:hypothetical protein
MFTPDSQSSSRHPLDYLWVTRSEILARGAVGGGGAVFVILVFIGLIYLFITAVFSFLAAIAGVIALAFMTGPLKLEAEENVGGVFVALGLGFLAFNGVSLILDIMFGTWLSVPGMLGLLGEPACRAPCMQGFQRDVNGRPLHMLVEDLGDFYTYTIGSEGAGLGRYLLQSIPGTLALSYVLGYALPAVPKTAGGLLRLFAAGCVAVVAAMVVAFPLMALLMMWLRNLIAGA